MADKTNGRNLFYWIPNIKFSKQTNNQKKKKKKQRAIHLKVSLSSSNNDLWKVSD